MGYGFDPENKPRGCDILVVTHEEDIARASDCPQERRVIVEDSKVDQVLAAQYV